MTLINIGFGNIVSKERVLAVISPDSAPVKRLITQSRSKGMLIDASYGRKTKSVLVCDSGHIILSALTVEAVFQRMNEEKADGIQGDNQ